MGSQSYQGHKAVVGAQALQIPCQSLFSLVNSFTQHCAGGHELQP